MAIKTSDRVAAALRNCVQHGDSDEMAELLDPLVATLDYVSWDGFDLSEPRDEERPYDLGAIIAAGAEMERESAAAGEDWYVLPDDGVGCHVVKVGAGSGDEPAVAELLRVGAVMESGG